MYEQRYQRNNRKSSNVGIHDLDDASLLCVFDHLPLNDLLHTIILVCDRWRSIQRAACRRRRSLLLLVGSPTWYASIETRTPDIDELVNNDGIRATGWWSNHALVSGAKFPTLSASLSAEIVQRLIAYFPNITSLRIAQSGVRPDSVRRVCTLLAHYREKLHSLKLMIYLRREDSPPQPLRLQSRPSLQATTSMTDEPWTPSFALDRMMECINDCAALKRLTLDLFHRLVTPRTTLAVEPSVPTRSKLNLSIVKRLERLSIFTRDPFEVVYAMLREQIKPGDNSVTLRDIAIRNYFTTETKKIINLDIEDDDDDDDEVNGDYREDDNPLAQPDNDDPPSIRQIVNYIIDQNNDNDEENDENDEDEMEEEEEEEEEEEISFEDAANNAMLRMFGLIPHRYNMRDRRIIGLNQFRPGFEAYHIARHLARRFTELRVFPIYDSMEKVRLLCDRFPRLTVLYIGVRDISMAKLAATLQPLRKLVCLNLVLEYPKPLPGEDEDDDRDDRNDEHQNHHRRRRSIATLPSVRGLSLEIRFDSHTDMRRLALHRIFPALQVIGIHNNSAGCRACSFRYMDCMDSYDWNPNMIYAAMQGPGPRPSWCRSLKTQWCMRRLLQPLKRCRALDRIYFDHPVLAIFGLRKIGRAQYINRKVFDP